MKNSIKSKGWIMKVESMLYALHGSIRIKEGKDLNGIELVKVLENRLKAVKVVEG